MTDSNSSTASVDTFIKNADTKALISYVATYRALKINKQNAIKCMQELDRRRQNGEDIPYEELIDNEASIYKSVGKGFVVRIGPDNDIEKTLSKIRQLKPDAIIYNKEQRLIHIGAADQNIQEQIALLPGVQKIEADKKVFKDAARSKIFDVG